MKEIFLILTFLVFTLGCNESGGGGGGSSLPDCTATIRQPTSGLMTTYLTGKNPYATTIKISNYEDIIRSDTSTCTQNYEIALFNFFSFSVDGIPFATSKPQLISAWKKVTYNNALISFSNFTPEVGSNFVAACIKATSTFGQESEWFCKDIWLNGSITNPSEPISTPNPIPAPTSTPNVSKDTTPPTTPTNLSISCTWGFSNDIYLKYTGSSDPESGIRTYITAILDMNFNQVTPDAERSYVPLSSLTPGADYYFAIMAQNNAGLNSQVAIKKFYYPATVSVTLAFRSLYDNSCTSKSVSMFDLQLVKLMQTEYTTCTLTKKTTSTYSLDCRGTQSCSNGYCTSIYGLINSFNCGGEYYSPILPTLSGSNY